MGWRSCEPQIPAYAMIVDPLPGSEGALDDGAAGLGADDHEAFHLLGGLARLVHERRHAADELAHVLAGDRRDDGVLEAEFGQLVELHRIGLSEGLRNTRTALDYLNDVLEPTLQALEQRRRLPPRAAATARNSASPAM